MHYILKLDAQQLNIIGDALAERPYRVVASVIADMQKQVQAQEQGAQRAEVQTNGATPPIEANKALEEAFPPIGE